jgi:hypothetical protein
MKMKKKPYVMKVAMPYMVRLAIDHLRTKRNYASDAELFGDVFARGVREMIGEGDDGFDLDDEPIDSPRGIPVENYLGFPIDPELQERLQRFFDESGVEDQEQMLALFVDYGLTSTEVSLRDGVDAKMRPLRAEGRARRGR